MFSGTHIAVATRNIPVPSTKPVSLNLKLLMVNGTKILEHFTFKKNSRENYTAFSKKSSVFQIIFHPICFSCKD
jgi:hypothetical protein